jgi:drug/metabolite transporter (DMT)-like permease
MTPRQKGLALVTGSALLFSTPGLFTRAVEAGGWEVSFWRAFFGVGFTMLFMLWRSGIGKEFQNFGKPGLLAAAVWATGAIAYITAFKLTSIANVSLIYGAAPFICAAVAWLVLREKPGMAVIIASIIAFSGVAVVGSGSLGRGNLVGDLLALWMTCTVAIQFVIMRKHPGTSALATTVTAALLVLPPSLFFGSPFTVPSHEIAILAVFGLVFVCAATMLTEGSKFLPASEAALISNLEVPIQPVLAYLIFMELPPKATFMGGAMILVAILFSQFGGRLSSRLKPESNT